MCWKYGGKLYLYFAFLLQENWTIVYYCDRVHLKVTVCENNCSVGVVVVIGLSFSDHISIATHIQASTPEPNTCAHVARCANSTSFLKGPVETLFIFGNAIPMTVLPQFILTVRQSGAPDVSWWLRGCYAIYVRSNGFSNYHDNTN